jgi:hypothetical protein
MVEMSAGIRKTSVAFVVAVVMTTFSVSSVAASPATAGFAVGTVDESVSEVKSSWTPGEMAEAAANGSPSPTPRAFSSIGPTLLSETASTGDFTPEDPTARPYRVHGKVFFRSRGDSFSCSGTFVDSLGHNVVATAGHCLYDRAARRFVEDLTFVPAWRGNATSSEERSPFGQWPARKLVATQDYRFSGQLGADIAFFTVSGEPTRQIGSRKIAFGLEEIGRPVTILGYPAKPEPLFDGKEMKGCSSTVVGKDNGGGVIFPAALRAVPCSMGAGSSGGGWVTAGGFLTSVVSYGYCPGVLSLCDSTFGPVLGSIAKSLYTSEGIGGSRRPSVTRASGPERIGEPRSVSFEVDGSGSTPVSNWCRLDGRRARKCSGKVTYRGLEPGRHVFFVQSIDQTGRRSVELRRAFTVTAAR